jgi:hypothetical protein
MEIERRAGVSPLDGLGVEWLAKPVQNPGADSIHPRMKVGAQVTIDFQVIGHISTA